MRSRSLDLNDFRKFIFSKKIICYGSGLAGIRAINIMENWGKEQDIIAFIDQDSKKWSKTICNEHCSYPIISLNDALKLVNKDVIILITCTGRPADVLEIRRMLEQYVELDNIECFSLVEIAQKQLLSSDYTEIVHESEESVIPKKIHYCWFGGAKPVFVRNIIESWKQICPDYQIIEWNETNYDVTKNKYMKQAYDAKVWGFVPDYARMDIVYQEGGIYLDTDVEILKKPDDLLFQKNFFINDGGFLVSLGSGFGAMEKDAMLKEFMDYYDDVSFISDNGKLNKLPSPMHQYNVLKKYGMIINDQFQKIHGINIYPMILGGTCQHTMQIRKSEKAFFAHYGTATWLENETLESRRKIRDYFQYDGLENYDINM